jgi:predicted  nucleic acid-binding Zn-ribbon protein
MVTSETKRRLLLSKWRVELATLRDAVTSHKTDVSERDEEIDNLRGQLKDAEEDLELAREAHVDEIAAMETALVAVRDWMHEPLFLGRPMRDPRKILRQVEEVL